MKNLAQLLLQSTVKMDDSLSKQERFNSIFLQLQERNASNQQFIRKFIAKTQKKYHQREIPSPPRLDTCPDIQEQERCSDLRALPPSCHRFHTEEGESHVRPTSNITSSQIIQNKISTVNELGAYRQKKEGRPSFGRGEKTIRDTCQEDQGFKNYLKKVYLREVDRKVKPVTHQQKGIVQRKSIQVPSTTKTKCLNIKSMVFGTQDLNYLPQQNQADVVNSSSEQQIVLSALQSSQAVLNCKLSNLFLPTIARQGKKDKMKVEKMMRVEGGDEERPDSKCRALWVSQSLSRIGLSFRINTIHIKKHS